MTTAIRTFALALIAGMVLSNGTAGEAGPLLTALALIAGVASTLEWGALARTTPWIPVGESGLVAILLTSAAYRPELLIYLAVPGVVAGVRHGWVTAINSMILGAVAVIMTLVLAPSADAGIRLSTSLPWLVVGLGVGLLASWQSRSSRHMAARQGPDAAAHLLMAKIHRLASSGTLGLNSASLATELEAAMRHATGCARSTIFIVDEGEACRPLNGGEDVDLLAREVEIPDAERTPGAAVVPLRGAVQILGYCVLVGIPKWTPALDARALEVADEFAVRLDTAVLFDEVRALATSEERNRIAREMHDGIAQEIVGLGYIVDEIESVSNQDQTRELASTLRAEITRLVSEIRFSIFDLRHEVSDHQLSGALAEYVREISQDSTFRVHLTFDESGPALPARTETELLRVAQEAIKNVRKHANAQNLWVTVVADGASIGLEIADDGVGNASPKNRHFGLRTMRERADRIGADLTVDARPEGGTVVRLLTRPTASLEGNHSS